MISRNRTKPNAMREAALLWAHEGFPVFPCRPRGKEPLIKNWPEKATTDKTTIQRWWRKWPDANVGVVAGRASDLWVLDIDGQEGDDSLTRLEQKHGTLRQTWEAITGRGWHQYFRMPSDGRDVRNSAGQLGPGLDVRGTGGYIIAPPSVHKSGAIYEWAENSGPDNVELANAPAWLLKLVTETKPQAAGADGTVEFSGSRKKLGQRDKVIMIGAQAELWHDADGETYATVEIDEHREHYALRSKGFRQWLLSEYGRSYTVQLPDGASSPSAPSSQARAEALNTLQAMASHGPEHRPCVRIAELEGAVYIDLGTRKWDAVKITRNGWTITVSPPVKFIRPPGLRPLPIPEKRGNIDLLRRYINVSTDGDFKLVVGGVIGWLSPRGPYPIMVLNGQQGSAKTTLCRVLRRLVDPNKAEVRAAPRSERDLAIAAKNGHVIALDNLSSIKPWLSDALCRVATGSGFATRSLYTNEEETIIEVCRPLIINGIPDLATRADLADRSIVLTLPPLEKGTHDTEMKFWKAFEDDAPRIMGGLFDAVACALKRRDTLTLSRVPRMADFAQWVEAAAPALGWKPETFLAEYEKNRARAIEVTVDADLVATAVLEFIDSRREWKGTATDLLSKLNSDAPDEVKRISSWPTDAARLSSRLRRATPALLQLDVVVEQSRRQGKSHIELRKAPQKSVTNATSTHDRDGGSAGRAKRTPKSKRHSAARDRIMRQYDPSTPEGAHRAEYWRLSAIAVKKSRQLDEGPGELQRRLEEIDTIMDEKLPKS